MTNGGTHDRVGKKKTAARKATPKNPKTSLKRKNLVPPALASEKNR